MFDRVPNLSHWAIMEYEVGGKLFEGTNYYNISFCLPHLSRNPSRKRFEKNSTQMVYLTMCLTSITLLPPKSPRLRANRSCFTNSSRRSCSLWLRLVAAGEEPVEWTRASEGESVHPPDPLLSAAAAAAASRVRTFSFHLAALPLSTEELQLHQ